LPPNRRFPSQNRLDDFHGDEYDTAEGKGDAEDGNRRSDDPEGLPDRPDGHENRNQHKLGDDGENQPFVGRGLKDAVSHGAEIQGDDQLYEDEEEENLGPCKGYIGQIMEKEIKERIKLYEKNAEKVTNSDVPADDSETDLASKNIDDPEYEPTVIPPAPPEKVTDSNVPTDDTEIDLASKDIDDSEPEPTVIPPIPRVLDGKGRPVSLPKSGNGVSENESIKRRRKPRMKFYDVKNRKRVVREVIKKTIYNETTYAARGKTKDGRNLTKFLRKGVFDSLHVPFERQNQQQNSTEQIAPEAPQTIHGTERLITETDALPATAQRDKFKESPELIPVPPKANGQKRPVSRSKSANGVSRTEADEKRKKPTMEFYDVKTRRKVKREVIAKTTYNTTYAAKGKTSDGRNLTKFVRRDVYDRIKVPVVSSTTEKEL